MPRRTLTPIVLAIILRIVVASPAMAQDPMELNRAGRWAEALALAAETARNADTSRLERCEAVYHAAYAAVRLGATADARIALQEFNSNCEAVTTGSWVEAEVARLAAGIEQVEPSTSLSPLDLNRAGRWLEARDAALRISRDADFAPSDRCAAAYNLLYATVRLHDFGSAEPALREFDAETRLFERLSR